VDGIIPEPAGGAHWDYVESAQILKQHLVSVIAELKSVPAADRVSQRIEKFGRMGFWEELPVSPAENAGASHITD
jgi:acetyl-CoA carboxylase carboxyl transferase subunit alpha